MRAFFKTLGKAAWCLVFTVLFVYAFLGWKRCVHHSDLRVQDNQAVPFKETNTGHELHAVALAPASYSVGGLHAGNIACRYEIIRETDDPKQLAKANKQFPNGWVWGAFDGGRNVAMPLANDRYPSGELLDWWSQHEPERFEGYMTNGVHGNGGEHRLPEIKTSGSMDEQFEAVGDYLRWFEQDLQAQIDRRREKLASLAIMEAKTAASLRAFGSTDPFGDNEEGGVFNYGRPVMMATTNKREVNHAVHVLWELRKELSRRHELESGELRRDLEADHNQVKAALDALDVEESDAGDTNVSTTTEASDDLSPKPDDLFGNPDDLFGN